MEKGAGKAKEIVGGLLPHNDDEDEVDVPGNLSHRVTELEATCAELETNLNKHLRHHNATLDKQVADLLQRVKELRREVTELQSAAPPLTPTEPIPPAAPTPAITPPPVRSPGETETVKVIAGELTVAPMTGTTPPVPAEVPPPPKRRTPRRPPKKEGFWEGVMRKKKELEEKDRKGGT
jgi:hypothetical protein